MFEYSYNVFISLFFKQFCPSSFCLFFVGNIYQGSSLTGWREKWKSSTSWRNTDLCFRCLISVHCYWDILTCVPAAKLSLGPVSWPLSPSKMENGSRCQCSDKSVVPLIGVYKLSLSGNPTREIFWVQKQRFSCPNWRICLTVSWTTFWSSLV